MLLRIQFDVRRSAQHKANKMQISFILTSLCSLTCLAPALLGIKKRKLINEKHSLFLVYIIIGCIVDLTGIFLVVVHQSGLATILNNLYVLFEGIVFSIIFFNWGIIGNKKFLNWILILLICIWLVDNFLLNSIHQVNSLFRVMYSIIIVLIATKQFQQVYLNTPKYASKEPLIIISATLIINYTYRAVFESVYLFKLSFSNNFYSNAFLILIILNTLINCAFTYAIHCMDLRKRLTLYY
jgi:hypothetical protein